MENVKVMVFIYLIQYIDMRVNGGIIVFMEMVDFLRTINCFFKDPFKMDLSMVMANINIAMETSLRETILKIKKGVKEGILLMREGHYNQSLIRILPKFLKFHYLTEPLTLVSKRMV